QILYILEEAPSNRRATIYSLIKGLGGLSAIFIPMMRATMMHNDPTQWRNVYMLPGFGGLAVVLLVFFFAKDTRVYVDKRVEELSVPYETRLEKREAEKAAGKSTHKTGVIPALKYIFRHKELRTLILIKLLFDAAIIAMTNFESIMYKAGMKTGEITTAEYFYPFIYCVSVMLSGVLADHIGRKKTIVIFGGICAVSFIGFIISTNRLWSPYMVGILYGLYLGGYWIGRDYMEIISTEMVPTKIRASIIGAESLLVYGGMAIGFVFVNVGILFMPIWLTCLIFAVPCVAVSTVLLFLKVKETKGIDYESISDADV
ncbi:MAG TPA: MFS transporter, partial [Clostridiales bacterium]|nr:MFS transporter [Clostridiales bacterium]